MSLFPGPFGPMQQPKGDDNSLYRFARFFVETSGSAGIVSAPAWSSLTAYVRGNIVNSGGNAYQCILANTNHVPPNATYWVLLPPAYAWTKQQQDPPGVWKADTSGMAGTLGSWPLFMADGSGKVASGTPCEAVVHPGGWLIGWLIGNGAGAAILASCTVYSGAQTATFIAPAGTLWIDVEVIAAGGAGGGTPSGSSSPVGGSGGGAGGYSRKTFIPAAIGASYAVTVGAGGTGAIGAAGGNGGTSSFIGAFGDATVICTGGNGGALSLTPITQPGFGGQGSGGDVNALGNSGQPTVILTVVGGVSVPFNGMGGASVLGGNGYLYDASGGITSQTPLYGSGGGGYLYNHGGVSVAKAGQNGADGIVIVRAYRSS